jgi:hypothetical protein
VNSEAHVEEMDEQQVKTLKEESAEGSDDD